MKAILQLLIVCAIGYGLYTYFEPDITRVWRASPEKEPAHSERPQSGSPRADPASAPSSTPRPLDVRPQSAGTPRIAETVTPPTPQGMKIDCPSCKGEGRLTYVDGRGQIQSYTCPICGFSGSRNITVPPNGHVCPDCKGMGRTEMKERRGYSRSGYIIAARRCMRCNTSGVVTPHAQSSR